jgi:hypothetical protein
VQRFIVEVSHLFLVCGIKGTSRFPGAQAGRPGLVDPFENGSVAATDAPSPVNPDNDGRPLPTVMSLLQASRPNPRRSDLKRARESWPHPFQDARSARGAREEDRKSGGFWKSRGNTPRGSRHAMGMAPRRHHPVAVLRGHPSFDSEETRFDTEPSGE